MPAGQEISLQTHFKKLERRALKEIKTSLTERFYINKMFGGLFVMTR